MIAAATVIAAFLALFVVAALYDHRRTQRQAVLDRHVADALAVANAPDLDGNVRFYDGLGVTR